jgi:hypothetical protein
MLAGRWLLGSTTTKPSRAAVIRLKDILRKNASTGKSKAGKLLEKFEDAGQLDEGRKYIDVNNREKIGIDRPHVSGQQVHGHLEGGRAVNKDGSVSHGHQPFYLTKEQAAALRRADFKIPKSRLIESENNGKVTLDLELVLVEWLEELKKSLNLRD